MKILISKIEIPLTCLFKVNIIVIFIAYINIFNIGCKKLFEVCNEIGNLIL